GFAEKLGSRLRAILTIQWFQAVVVTVLVYGCLWAERKLLGSTTDPIAVTSAWACYARMVIIIGITLFSTLFLLGTTRPRSRMPKPPSPSGHA
ncbi:MAG TPA: hypothetical protein VLK84_13965, partial [Longimicrobium sp.]|nr:hypothetical protein [Longimicrobium sp.]